MLVTGPSAHLSWKELACKDGSAYPFEWKMNRVIILAEIFEFIRGLCGGKPIKIHSAYRTPDYNRLVGGVVNSQHVMGRALDLGVPSGMTINHFHQIISAIPMNTALRGIGKYKTFVHVDVRPTEKRVIWDFSK